jgi:rod shape-determining protein MreD
VIVTPVIGLRMALIVVLGVLLQVTFFSRVELFHTSPDILPSVVVSLGLLGGSMTGAVSGFSAGLLLDCLLIAPLGASSLVVLSTGYLAGLYRERFDLGTRFTPPLLCMGLTLFALTAGALMELLLGVDAPVSALIVRDILIKTIYGFFLGWPIYLATKFALRAALVDDRAARRTPSVVSA